jgi:Zn-dependent protease
MVDVNAQNLLILVLILLFSMSLHEMMHAFTSHWLGDDTAYHQGRVTFNPLAHIDPFYTVLLPIVSFITFGALFSIAKPVQVNFRRLRYGEFGGAIVGMVGPLTNLVIAVLAAVIFNHAAPIQGSAEYNAFRIAIELNTVLFIFNSIPWPPLDGSRLLYAFAPRPLQEFMERIESTGYTSIFALILVIYLFGSPIQSLMDKIVHLLAPALI